MLGILRASLIGLVLAVAAPAPAQAQDFQRGAAAWLIGDYETALSEWRPLAEAGIAEAQSWLGIMYANGQGVPQDYVQAHMWYSLAALRGDVQAKKNRELLAEEMSPDQIAEAARLARKWVAKHRQ